MLTNLSTWLREQRLAHSWSVAEMGRQLHRAAKATDDHTVPSTAILTSYVRRWEAGKIGLTERYRLHYCTALGIPPAQFGPHQPQPRGATLPSVGVTSGDVVTASAGISPNLRPSTQTARTSDRGVEWNLVMNAAHESSEHAAASESASIGPNALEQISEDILRIARAYVHAPPLPLLAELIRVRDRAYWLLDQTCTPAHQRDLYLAAGQACGLLASASFDLGYPHAAAQQARASRAYGAIIGCVELSAWADGMLACIELWAGRPRQALLLAERGLAVAPDGTCRVRLWCIAARAAALQSDEQRAVDAIVASKRARATRPAATELHDSIGGEFSFNLARQAFCNGSAYLKLGRPEEALAECGQAVNLYAQAGVDERWYAAEAGARADLAAAHLLQGDLAGARESLSGVFTLHPGKRVEGVVRRLSALREVLAVGSHNKDAQTLVEEIEQFTATTAVQVLPKAPS
jgi:tetratricopeptide (TPR) repeat protein